LHDSIKFNDRFISIPCGSEDDKNVFKRNIYEESIFKFEEQRFELDMVLEILRHSLEVLQELNDRVIKGEIVNVDVEKDLGAIIIRSINRFYKDSCQQVLKGIQNHPIDSIPIVINRFKKRLDEATNQKVELKKNIKISFDKIYYKFLDVRTYKLKNYEKKNNNPKAFLKEILTKQKEKLSTNNINVLKGGNENFEFYSSLNLKFFKENVKNIIKDVSASNILMCNLK
jgi:paired amphipathic helix protein Sin3a